MNTNLALQILQLAVALLSSQLTGKVQQDATLAKILLQIAGKVFQAYQQETGKPLDPALIKVESLV